MQHEHVLPCVSAYHGHYISLPSLCCFHCVANGLQHVAYPGQQAKEKAVVQIQRLDLFNYFTNDVQSKRISIKGKSKENSTTHIHCTVTQALHFLSQCPRCSVRLVSLLSLSLTRKPEPLNKIRVTHAGAYITGV